LYLSKAETQKRANQRSLIKGKFGQAKNAYEFSKRKDTSESWINAIFFIINLSKIADKYAVFDKFI
jgi:hypothetical protein